jgi:hypothetical protein
MRAKEQLSLGPPFWGSLRYLLSAAFCTEAMHWP